MNKIKKTLSNESFVVKCVVVGDTCGKSNIVSRFICNKFRDDNSTTIGYCCVSKNIVFGKYNIKLAIWDIGSGFSEKIKDDLHNVNIIFVVYDLTSEKSYNNMREWIVSINSIKPHNSVVAIIANKYDVLKNNEDTDEIKLAEFIGEYDLLYFPCSAKTNYNITNMFTDSLYEFMKINKFKLNKNIHTRNALFNVIQNGDNSIIPISNNNNDYNNKQNRSCSRNCVDCLLM